MVLVLGATGCGSKKVYHSQKYHLGAPFKVTFLYKSNREGRRRAERIFKRIFGDLQALSSKLNPLTPYSDLSSVNGNSSLTAVAVGKEVFQIILKGTKATELTEGAFRITFEPLLQLISLSGKNPPRNKVKEVLFRIRPSSLVLDKQFHTIKFRTDGTKVNVTRIQRGYAIDNMIKVFKRNKVTSAYLQVGRTTYALGKKKGFAGGSYLAAIPEKSYISPQTKIKIKNKAFSLASIDEPYFRNVKYWGKYINKEFPVTPTVLTGVTAPNAITAEVLSDALMIMGPDKGLKLLDELGYDGFLIIGVKGSYEVVTSPKFSGKIVPNNSH